MKELEQLQEECEILELQCGYLLDVLAEGGPGSGRKPSSSTHTSLEDYLTKHATENLTKGLTLAKNPRKEAEAKNTLSSALGHATALYKLKLEPDSERKILRFETFWGDADSHGEKIKAKNPSLEKLRGRAIKALEVFRDL